MKYLYSVKEDMLGYKMFIFPNEIKLLELVFEDMGTLADLFFKNRIENVLNGISEHESIGGNICWLNVNKDFTDVSADFVNEGMENECRIETKELYSLMQIWEIMNEDKLGL